MTVSFRIPSKTAAVKQFIEDAGCSIVSVEFIKADGSLRKLQFNPRDRQEVKGTGHALKAPSIVRCRDFSIARKEGQGAWRSFDCERVVSIKANGQMLALWSFVTEGLCSPFWFYCSFNEPRGSLLLKSCLCSLWIKKLLSPVATSKWLPVIGQTLLDALNSVCTPCGSKLAMPVVAGRLFITAAGASMKPTWRLNLWHATSGDFAEIDDFFFP
jgi:hypothetical protein